MWKRTAKLYANNRLSYPLLYAKACGKLNDETVVCTPPLLHNIEIGSDVDRTVTVEKLLADFG